MARQKYIKQLSTLFGSTVFTPKTSPEKLYKESIDYCLFHCQNLHKTPSESFFKHTIFGLRALYKVLGMSAQNLSLPQIKSDSKLPIVLNKREVKDLLGTLKHLKHRLILAVLVTAIW
jgi:integrase/recombinase XerD